MFRSTSVWNSISRWLPLLIYWCHVCIPPVVRNEACVVGSLVDNSEDGCNAGCEGLEELGSYPIGSDSFVHFEPRHHLLHSWCCDHDVSGGPVWRVWHEVVWDVSYLVEYWLELSFECIGLILGGADDFSVHFQSHVVSCSARSPW